MPFLFTSHSYMYIELIINSVVLLFVNEVDSQVFSIAYIFNSKWLHTVVDEAEEYSDNLLEQDVVDDSVLEAAHEAKSENRSSSSKRLGNVANSLRASAQDQARASGSSSKRRLGASSIRSRSMKSTVRSNLSESQQQELMMKFEVLQRQMSELQAELTGESPVDNGTLNHGADDDDEGNDQDGQEDETPQQQSSCAVQ